VRSVRLLATLRVVSVLSLTAAGLAVSTGSGSATPPPAGPGPVSSTPAAGTPRLPTTTATTEQIRQIVQCGSMMYAVGNFSQVMTGTGSTDLTRNGVFSFGATAPFKLSSFAPVVSGNTDGTVVNTIAFNGGDCSHAYIGGKFTSVDGMPAKNIAEIDTDTTTTGGLVSAFKHSASGSVDTMVGWHGHILTGGEFTGINSNSNAQGSINNDPSFASLDPTTGTDDGALAGLSLSGNYVFTDQAGDASASNTTSVYNQQLSPDGSKDLVEGVFTSIGGQARRQVAMIDLPSTVGAPATTDAWYAPEFDANCNFVDPAYAQAGAWSPDGSAVYIASTGYKPDSGPGYAISDPRAGLCDTAAAFPTTSATVTHTWLNYTGCDSLFSTAADASTVYFAGHERWTDNATGCDVPGVGSIEAGGLEGLSPTDGSLTNNTQRDRGYGADDMLITSAGLWIASDNYQGSASCGGVAGHAGLCLLPYTKAPAAPTAYATAPAITGTVAVGNTVACDEPQPAGVSIAYSWGLAGPAKDSIPVPIASTPTYTIPVADYLQKLTCQVTVQLTSSPTSPSSVAVNAPTVVARGRALRATTKPSLVRVPVAGDNERVIRGVWSPTATVYHYQWSLNGKPIKNATHIAVRVPRSARGKFLTCTVTAQAKDYTRGIVTTRRAKVAKR
jgi:hypothetical protein